VNRPFRTPSFDAGPLGDVGDEVPPPQADAIVAKVAQDAIWHASAQKRRRETELFVSDIVVIPDRTACAAGDGGRQDRGRP